MSQTQPIRFDDRTAFHAWAERQGGRWERHDGIVVAMAPERVAHTRVRYAVWAALKAALRDAGLPCEAMGGGVTVRVDDRTDYGPDALVVCGGRVDGSQVAVDDPAIVVEVLSASTEARDLGVKLTNYFRLGSMQHYLVFAADTMRVIHYRRWTEDRLLTRIQGNGIVEFDPPGVRLSLAECYRDTGLPGAP